MNFENCTEWKKSYKKPHSVWFRLHEMSRIDKSTGTEGGLVAARVWEVAGGMGSDLPIDFFGDNEDVIKLIVVITAQLYDILKTMELL